MSIILQLKFRKRERERLWHSLSGSSHSREKRYLRRSMVMGMRSTERLGQKGDGIGGISRDLCGASRQTVFR